jgi:hypothetical protein
MDSVSVQVKVLLSWAQSKQLVRVTGEQDQLSRLLPQDGDRRQSPKRRLILKNQVEGYVQKASICNTIWTCPERSQFLCFFCLFVIFLSSFSSCPLSMFISLATCYLREYVIPKHPPINVYPLEKVTSLTHRNYLCTVHLTMSLVPHYIALSNTMFRK